MSNLAVDVVDAGQCKCGHSIGSHYKFNVAMPCGYCICERCECAHAEVLRRYRSAPDHAPGRSWLIARAARLRGEKVPWLLTQTPWHAKRRTLTRRRKAARARVKRLG